ncbi:hypothetical protein Lal_00023518 [Lupinus albus]|nr:hypothetical protein Lal_00023518 [Lupinus albus]
MVSESQLNFFPVVMGQKMLFNYGSKVTLRLFGQTYVEGACWEGFDDFNVKPSNPFFLHLSVNPSLVLVSPLLNGKNIHLWSKAMKLALQSKNKLRFIDHNITQPPFQAL